MNKTVAMNKTVIMGAALCAASFGLAGCGGGSSGPAVQSSSGSTATASPPATSSPQTEMLDTQQVLALADVQSDTSDPKPVGVGAWMVADADDETSDPVPVG
jgi:hypothetical protein